MKNKTCFIYALKDRSGIRYIGKADEPETRFKHHYWEAFNPNGKEYNLYKSKWFRKYVEQISYEILEECEYDKWPEREVFWVSYYKDRVELVNTSIGGKGGSGPKSEKTRKKISDSHKGKKASEKTKKLMSETRAGSNNGFSKSVDQFTLEGIFIKTFGSIVDASKETKTNRVSISKCATGVQKTAGGFIWKHSKNNKE